MAIIELSMVIGAIVEMGVEAVWDKTKRREAVIKVLRKVGLKPDAPPSDFDGIYAYTLVEYGTWKPRPILEFFRHEFIRNAFRQSFEMRDPAILQLEAESLIEWHSVGKELRRLDVDPRGEFARFTAVFSEVVDRSRTPGEVRREQKLSDIDEDIHRATGTILERLGALDTLPEIRAELSKLSEDGRESRVVDLEVMRADYLAYLRRVHAYLDLGGIAPKVANRTVKLRIEDIYVPVLARRETRKDPSMLDLYTYLSSHLPKDDVHDTLEHRLSEIDQEQEQLGSRLLFIQTAASSLIRRVPVDEFQSFSVSLIDTLSHLSSDSTSLSEIRLRNDMLFRCPKRFDIGDESALIADILNESRAVLLGHPGTGKSTTLRYIVYKLTTGDTGLLGEQAGGRLPILVRLVDYAKICSEDGPVSLRDYLLNLHDRERGELFRAAMSSGCSLIMLDGLDEIIDANLRAKVADQVEDLVANYPDNHFLVTSRIVGYEASRLTGEFTHFILGPLPKESIQDFVQKWYEAIEREGGIEGSTEAKLRATELSQAIDERPGIRRLAENPLLLTVIALVNWKGRKLPNRRVEVYRYAAETLVESWPRVRRGVSFDSDEVLALLAPVAYQIFSYRSSEEIGENELLRLLTQSTLATRPGLSPAEATAHIKELLPRLSEHSGLFLERGIDPDNEQRMFGFLHLTFAEYFSARYLASLWEADKNDMSRRALLAQYAQSARWNEVVLLMAQHVGIDDRRTSATQMISDLLELPVPFEEYLHRNLILAAQCLADDLRVDPYAAEWVLSELVALMVETPIAPLRDQLVTIALAMRGTVYEDTLLAKLLEHLTDSHEQVRVRVAAILGKFGGRQALSALSALSKDLSESVRCAVVNTLVDMPGKDSERLLSSLIGDKSEIVRCCVVSAFRERKSEPAMDELLRLTTDDSPKIRAMAVLALGELGDRRSVSRLMTLIADDEEVVRSSVARALARIDDQQALDGLLMLLKDKSPGVRAEAAIAAHGFKDSRVQYELEALLSDPHGDVCASAKWALRADDHPVHTNKPTVAPSASDWLKARGPADEVSRKLETAKTNSVKTDVTALLPLLSDDRYLASMDKPVCDWAYDSILETLAKETSEPGAASIQARRETIVAGPWSRGVSKRR